MKACNKKCNKVLENHDIRETSLSKNDESDFGESIVNKEAWKEYTN